MSHERPAPVRPLPGHARSAFTIVELLVVVAILSILIALLFPALQRIAHSCSYLSVL